jgi:ParB family transcriptional regulator, chromosome partitioning protein
MIAGLMEELDISEVKQSKSTITRDADDDEVANLARSIKQRGLLQPIIVRIIREDPGVSFFEIVAGNRRYKACKYVGLRKILCHIVELDDKAAFEISLIENIERRTLHPLEEARAFKIYIQQYGWGGISDLAAKIGKSPSFVARRIKLLEFPEEILRNISNHKMDPSTAEELVSIHDSETRTQLANLALNNSWSSRKLRQVAKEYKENSSVYDFEGVYGEVPFAETKASRVDQRTQRAFNKSIISLRIAMKQIADIISTIEDNWIIYELLLQHKNMLHSQIDILIKQRSKL